MTLARVRSRTGRTMRSLVEKGLRRCLEPERSPKRYKLPDLSVGDSGGPNLLEALSWQDLRSEIYERR
jgi:hypothetical protein